MKLMMIPNTILRNKSIDLDLPLNDKNSKLAKKMSDHIFNSLNENNGLRPGVGIAANQVGFNLNMFFVHIPNEEGEYMTDLIINPKIMAESKSKAALEHGEGCLSVPDDYKNTSGLVVRS
jgi:peptide deformylase